MTDNITDNMTDNTGAGRSLYSQSTAPSFFFDLSGFAHAAIFSSATHVWEALSVLSSYIDNYLAKTGPVRHGNVMDGAWIGEQVYLAAGAVVEPGAMVKGPAIIGPDSVVRQGAYIREYCLVGANCVIGHTSELKGSIMLDGSQAPHFNYVGDSILGRRVNLGAGTKLSNLKNDHTIIAAATAEARVSTGLQKLGAIIGDDAAIGCNVVTSPGTLIGPGAIVYANVLVRGFVPPRSIVKLRQDVETVPLH